MLDKDTKSLLEAVNKIINPIDEISDEKLKSYLDKSMTSKPERWKGEKGEKTGKAWVKAADKVEKKAVNEESEQLDEAHIADGYHVVGGKTQAYHGFHRSKDSALHHADSLENNTGYVHQVHQTKGGKIKKTWQWSDSEQKQSPHTDWKDQDAHHVLPPRLHENVEELDELSKKTLGLYIKKATDSKDALNDAADRNHQKGHAAYSSKNHKTSDVMLKLSAKQNKKAQNRRDGIFKAADRLAKENVEFSEAELAYMAEILDEADAQELEELSKSTLGSYIKKASGSEDEARSDHLKGHVTIRDTQKYFDNPDNRFAGKNFNDKTFNKALRIDKNRSKGIQKAVYKLTKEEADVEIETLDEKRGRPPKSASTSDEPRQHVIQQLQRAKLSLTGGSKVKFKDGTEHHISGTHASKVLDKYMSLKPSEKEAFQTKVGQSHEHLKSEL